MPAQHIEMGRAPCTRLRATYTPASVLQTPIYVCVSPPKKMHINLVSEAH